VRRFLAAVAVVAVAFACTTLAQRKADTIRSARKTEDVLYFPNERLLKSFTCGQSSVVADILWLKCIQYTSKEFHGDFKFTLLDRMLGTITRLDPHFVDAYKWGGVFLAMLKRDNDASIELLASGIEKNPTSWELPFEIARTYVLNRHDDVMGAKWMAVAASTGEPPRFVVDWAKNLEQKHNLGDIERGMWQQIIQNTSDPNMRETAQRRIIEVDLRETCRSLDEAVKRYQETKGAAPTSIDDLAAAGLIEERPADPLGGKFFINMKGAVQNTTLLDSQTEERRIFLQGYINQYKEMNGTWPESLDALREKGNLVPTYPYLDREWRYDPSTGEAR
jgi:hypothetical protein